MFKCKEIIGEKPSLEIFADWFHFRNIHDSISYTKWAKQKIESWESSGCFVRTYIIVGDSKSIDYFKKVMNEKNFNSWLVLSSFNLLFINFFKWWEIIRKKYSKNNVNK